MNYAPELLLIGAVASVGVLHTIVPDHWVPITLIARQRGWSKAETARAAFQAGTGHVLSTLLIGLVVWFAGVVVAARFGHLVETASSIALIALGGWIAISAWRELRTSGGRGHSHSHGFGHSEEHQYHDDQNQVHGPELQQITTGDGVLELSIFEAGVPPRFRLSGVHADAVTVETLREGGARQVFRVRKARAILGIRRGNPGTARL
jgi:ABC-type nickel/cobalt efflux system permease component RcnA